MIFQKTARRLSDIARTCIGPCAALLVIVADRLTGFALGVSLDLDIAIVPTGTIGLDLKEAVARFDNARATHTGNAAITRDPRRHGILQPAHRTVIAHGRIIETPCAATAIALALQGAHGRIAGRHLRTGIIIARPIEAGLRMKRPDTRKTYDDERNGDRGTKAHA